MKDWPQSPTKWTRQAQQKFNQMDKQVDACFLTSLSLVNGNTCQLCRPSQHRSEHGGCCIRLCRTRHRRSHSCDIHLDSSKPSFLTSANTLSTVWQSRRLMSMEWLWQPALPLQGFFRFTTCSALWFTLDSRQREYAHGNRAVGQCTPRMMNFHESVSCL